MHLTFESNIRLPGSFVVMQGIPGDGLSNTIDLAPDFDHLSHPQDEAQSRDQQQERMETSNGPSATAVTSPSVLSSSQQLPFQTFLGQGIPSLFFSRPFLSTTRLPHDIRTTTRHGTPSETIDHDPSTAEAPLTHNDGGDPMSDESYVLVDDERSMTEQNPGESVFRGSSVMAPLHPPIVQHAIDLWQEERAASHRRDAAEWLESAMQQRYSSGRRAGDCPTISVFSRIIHPTNDRWWLCPKTAQLRVFSTLPCPRPSEEEGANLESLPTVPPGTTLVGMAIHTFDLHPQRIHASHENRNESDLWKYNGQNSDFNGEEWIPHKHCPQSGRIQYLHIESPYQGYILFSVDGYYVLAPGSPSSSLFSGLDNDDHSGSCWWWKVTYHDGAIVRQGLDLTTKHLSTLPFGSHVQVLRKVVNAVGLSRLLVRAHLVGNPRVQGWCSQFLNPMAGQRGAILQPVPLAIPVWYHIRQSCTVRKEVELSSAVVTTLEIVGATTPVLARRFTEFPAQSCLQRLQLAPQAYASLRLNAPPPTRKHNDAGSQLILQPTGDIDGTFDPASPGQYHWQNHLKWTRSFRVGLPSSVDAEWQVPMLAPVATPTTAERNLTSAPPVASTGSSLEQVAAADVSSDGESSSSSSSSSSSPNNIQPQNQSRLCMCCEDKVANATLIHGKTGHICCCLECARIIEAQKLGCPICRLEIDNVILHFYS